MSIGTSLGGFYEDEHHYESRDYKPEKGKVGGNVANYDNVGIVINPGDPGFGLTQDQNEFTIEGGDLNNQPGLIKQVSDIIPLRIPANDNKNLDLGLGGLSEEDLNASWKRLGDSMRPKPKLVVPIEPPTNDNK